MSEPKFTPGPWKLLKTSWENSLICAEDGTLIAICKIHADVTEDTQDEFEKIKDLNADLIADAWQLPNLRRENAELKAINKEMYEALEEVWRILDATMPLSRDNRADRIKRILRKARGETE